MSSANDNHGASRRVRDGLSKKWPHADFVAVASDEALLRLADARNTSSKSANIMMILASGSSFLYLLRLQGLANDIKIGDYDISKIPFGLFVLGVTALLLSTISLIRIGDSRSYDRQLRLACEKRFDGDCDLRYLAFPNEHAWGEPFSRMAYIVEAERIASGLRAVALLLANIFLFGITVSPLAAGIDFVINERWEIDTAFQSERAVLVYFLLAANLSMILLVSWLRLADRD